MNDDDPVPISALQHWAYCPRQCGLIHLEQAFDDNLHTQRGQAVHAQVDKPGVEERKGLRVERALPVWNDELGLIGKADVVEFEPDGTPYPVEYKHGSRNKAADIAACDDVQLAAQALCLEAMTGRAVSEGALYYASSKRRRVVAITPNCAPRWARRPWRCARCCVPACCRRRPWTLAAARAVRCASAASPKPCRACTIAPPDAASSSTPTPELPGRDMQLLNTLYVTTPQSWLRLDNDTCACEVEREVRLRVPLHHLQAVVCFGHVGLSAPLMHRLAEDGIALVLLDSHGRFKARLEGAVSGNVLLRKRNMPPCAMSHSRSNWPVPWWLAS